jgi:hypothetical protein
MDLDLGCLFGEEGEEVLGEVGGEVFCLALARGRFVDLSLSLSLFLNLKFWWELLEGKKQGERKGKEIPCRARPLPILRLQDSSISNPEAETLIIPPSREQLLVGKGKESDCREGSEVIELNFESARLLPLLCKIPTISTPPFGLDLLGALRREGSTTTVVWERCFIELLGGGRVVPSEGSPIKSAQRREPISSDDSQSVASLSSLVEEGALRKMRRKRSLSDFLREREDFSGNVNVHEVSSCDELLPLFRMEWGLSSWFRFAICLVWVDGREACSADMKSVESRLSILIILVLLLSGFIFVVLSVSVSASVFSCCPSTGGEAES